MRRDEKLDVDIDERGRLSLKVISTFFQAAICFSVNMPGMLGNPLALLETQVPIDSGSIKTRFGEG